MRYEIYHLPQDFQKRDSTSSSSYRSQTSSEVETILNTILPPKGLIPIHILIIFLNHQSLRRMAWCGASRWVLRRQTGGTWRLWGKMVTWSTVAALTTFLYSGLSLTSCWAQDRPETRGFARSIVKMSRSCLWCLVVVRCGGSCTPSARMSWSDRPPSPAWSGGCCCSG